MGEKGRMSKKPKKPKRAKRAKRKNAEVQMYINQQHPHRKMWMLLIYVVQRVLNLLVFADCVVNSTLCFNGVVCLDFQCAVC